MPANVIEVEDEHIAFGVQQSGFIWCHRLSRMSQRAL